MQKLLLAILFVLTLAFNATAQSRSSPKSYALIIGVSTYQDEKITSLKYAHKDAEKFAEQCASPNGLNIPQDQIKLLTNENASYWNIVDGLDWLKLSAKKDDKVYIYFAGHGDMESKSLKFGYLLAFDSRYMNYLGRSISLDLLNKTAHTLSVDKGAKVFLITDACHSGKLAGVDFNGNNLVALNLMQRVSNNEVRITSCNEGELSYEDESWGNGRGAFSYFLNKGMAGEADGISGTKDDIISIAEIKSYLLQNVPDQVKIKKRAKQNPVIMGTDNTTLNTFNPKAENEFAEPVKMPSITENTSTSSTGGRGVGSETIWQNLVKDIQESVSTKIENKKIDYKDLLSKDKESIVKILISDLINENKYEPSLLNATQTSDQIAKVFYDKIQTGIDAYLSGDEAELEKRRYYNQKDAPFDDYPVFCELSIKLIRPNHTLIPTLKLYKEYLEGTAFRLKLPLLPNTNFLIGEALKHQLAALKLEPNAAYVHNELGILYSYTRQAEKSKMHFEKAIAIAPMWAIPYANLASMYLAEQNYTLAKENVQLAQSKQNTLQKPYIVDGSIYVMNNNLLYAEEQFQHAIKLNNNHFAPYEKLGELYLKTQEYDLAKYNFHEAELRKIGLYYPALEMSDFDSDGVNGTLDKEPSLPPLNTANLKENDIIGTFALGKEAFDKNQYAEAKRWFEKVVLLDVNNPLVYHYLGQIAYSEEKLDQADFYFDLAIQFHVSDSTLLQQVNDMASTIPPLSGAEDIYTKSNFEVKTTSIFRAITYEKWGHYTQAIDWYNKCIMLDPTFSTAYAKLWQLYLERNQLVLAENTITRYGAQFPSDQDAELASFYDKVITRNKEDLQLIETYSYRYGLLLHHLLMHTNNSFEDDLLPKKTDFETIDNEPHMIVDLFRGNENLITYELNWVSAPPITKPSHKAVDLFKQVISISIDKNVRADAYAKMGDIYYKAKSYEFALENYENSLRLIDDEKSIRSKAIDCADQLYEFKKSFAHLETLKETGGLDIDDGMLLASYYMKKGDSLEAYTMSKYIIDAHPFLKEEMELEMIKMALRFENYGLALDLIGMNKYNEEYEYLPYMLAKCFAGLKNEKMARIKMQKCITTYDVTLAYFYKSDTAFDAFRNTPNWKSITESMNKAITEERRNINKGK